MSKARATVVLNHFTKEYDTILPNGENMAVASAAMVKFIPEDYEPAISGTLVLKDDEDSEAVTSSEVFRVEVEVEIIHNQLMPNEGKLAEIFGNKE